MTPLTTNATRLTLSSHFPRRTARMEACTTTRGGGDSGCDSDITRRGEVGWGKRRRARVSIVIIIDVRCVCLGGHGGTRGRRGSNGVATSGAIAAAPDCLAALLALCALARPVRGAFSRCGSYVDCDAGGSAG